MSGNIRFLWREAIDTAQWDSAVDRAANGAVYAYSFYLDALCTHWAALVLNDYEAVMPLPWRRKYGIYYLYFPALIAQLGLFGNGLDAALLEAFLKAIPKQFKIWSFPLNRHNLFMLPAFPLHQRTNFVLDLHRPYEEVYAAYRDNLKRNLKKAVGYGCAAKSDIDIKGVMELAKAQTGPAAVAEEDLQRFERLYHLLRSRQMATTYGVFTARGELVASCVLTFSHRRAYYILVGNHPNGRTLGASHLLIDAFIKDHAGHDLLLDFEGSDLRNLAFFYSSFGAVNEPYAAIELNRLPFYLKWLKK
ncbi:GNAT family N-acetyltransferase [Paraflavisolibacter sp. H34]|uniref:GNAT family N-acetyltransferase n=1 Tax=Huijunlia imazamoxiresistens TaxID=3127457 RepID=UPI0030173BE1